jgi:aldehyde dehydrogenase (NAD+)
LKGRSLNPTAEAMDIIRPTDGQVARVTLADEEDTRRAIAAAKHATYGRSMREEGTEILRQLHEGRFAATR